MNQETGHRHGVGRSYLKKSKKIPGMGRLQAGVQCITYGGHRIPNLQSAA